MPTFPESDLHLRSKEHNAIGNKLGKMNSQRNAANDIKEKSYRIKDMCGYISLITLISVAKDCE